MIGLFKKPELRAVDASKFGLASDPDYNSSAGVAVNQETALTLSAVYGASRLLANDIGTLPVHAFRERAGRRTQIDPEPIWFDEPNPWNPNESGVDHRAQVVSGMVLGGDGLIFANPSVYDPVELHVLNPHSVEIERDGRGAPSYTVRDGSKTVRLTADNCLHAPLFRLPGEVRGLSPIEAMKRGIGRGIAAEDAGARLFGQGSLIQGLVEYPKEAADPDPEQVKDMLRGLNRRHKGIKNAWALGALTGGATFRELTLKPRDAQAIETEEWTLEQFARTLGVPPSMLGSQKPGAVAYASVEQRSIDYVVHAIVPIVIRLEKAYSRLLPRGSYVKFNVAALMRGDAMARAQFYQIALQNKWMTRDEVRVFEDMEPLGLGFLETPNNNLPNEPEAQPEQESQEEPRFVLHVNGSPIAVSPTPVTVDNRVEPTPVTVENRVQVDPTPVHVDAPNVTVENRVETPEVRVENNVPLPTVNVHPALEIRANQPTGPQHVVVDRMPRRVHKAVRDQSGQIEGSVESDE